MTEPKTAGNGSISCMDPEKMHDRTTGGSISRQAAIDIVRNRVKKYTTPCVLAVTDIQQLPSAQPEIIRCKDCKYCEHWYRDRGRCFLWHETGIDVFKDGYCNYAERRQRT